MGGSAGEDLLHDFLGRLQQSLRIRRLLGIALVLSLLGVAATFLYALVPRQYALTISGGDLLGNRHFLAKLLKEEGEKDGLSLRILPSGGSVEVLESLDAGKLDLAIIQGGLDAHYPNVVHVATVSPELIHFLVKPGLTNIKDLSGKLVNLGGKGGGTRIVAKEILRYSGLEENVDYIESNYSNEDLVSLRPEKLPDVVVVVSFAPSFMADHLVKERGYRLLEMPFPASLSLRLGWVADTKVLAYTYSIMPPVPDKDVKTVGVYSHLVANRKVDPHAIFKVLETLYGPELENRFRQKFDEAKQLTLPSGFEISAGTELFLARKEPLLSVKTFDKIKSLFGLILSVVSTLLVVWRWFKAEPKQSSDDKEFKGYLKKIAGIESRLAELEQSSYSAADLDALSTQLATVKREVTARSASAELKDPGIVRTILLCLVDAREHISSLYAASRPGDDFRATQS